MNEHEDLDRQRRRILRRISLLTWGLFAAALLLAIAGGAMIAWLVRGAGMPFVRTWIIVSLLLVAVPLAVHVAPKPWRRNGEAE